MGASQSTTPDATAMQAPSTTPEFDALQAKFDVLIGSCEEELEGFSQCANSMQDEENAEKFREACREKFEAMAYCMQSRQTRATAIGSACGDLLTSYQQCMIKNAPGAAATEDAEVAAAFEDEASLGAGACVPMLAALLACSELAVAGKLKHSSEAPGADNPPLA